MVVVFIEFQSTYGTAGVVEIHLRAPTDNSSTPLCMPPRGGMAHRIELLTGSVANTNVGIDYSVRLRAIAVTLTN